MDPAYRQETAAACERTAGWLSGSCLLLRREAFDSVDGFDSRYFMYFEDVDLGDRIGRAGWLNVYVPEAEVVHIGGHSTARASEQDAGRAPPQRLPLPGRPAPRTVVGAAPARHQGRARTAVEAAHTSPLSRWDRLGRLVLWCRTVGTTPGATVVRVVCAGAGDGGGGAGASGGGACSSRADRIIVDSGSSEFTMARGICWCRGRVHRRRRVVRRDDVPPAGAGAGEKCVCPVAGIHADNSLPGPLPVRRSASCQSIRVGRVAGTRRRKNGMSDLHGVDAVVLVGGKGTRLRPLTLSAPKPMLPTAGVPFLDAPAVADPRGRASRTSCWARRYKAEVFADYFGDGSALGLELEYVIEDEPLGTRRRDPQRRGPAARADTSMVFNGDILSGVDLAALLATPTEADGGRDAAPGARSTDPRAFGCVPTDERRSGAGVPGEDRDPPTDQINAGCYVFRREVIDAIPAGRPVSVERETFPGLLAAGARLQGYVDASYWLDLGTPAAFVQGSADLVRGVAPSAALHQLG